MENISKGEKGRPKCNVFDNHGYTRLVCLLALGFDTPKQIKKEYPKKPSEAKETPESTVMTKYLYAVGLPKKRKRKSEKNCKVPEPQIRLIDYDEDNDKMKFKWDVFLGQVYSLMLSDMYTREKQLKDYISQTESNQKQYQKRIHESNVAKNRRLVIRLKNNIRECVELTQEFKDIIPKIDKFKKEAQDFFLKESKHHIWFINILRQYFRKTLCVCEQTKDYPTLNHLLRDFLLSEACRHHETNKLSDFDEFMRILKEYSFYYNMNLRWIINLKIRTQAKEDVMLKDFEREQEKEAERYYNQVNTKDGI